jgi:catechol 2,3-dioxygenase-like lactoylglutathione lyase family enzyme
LPEAQNNMAREIDFRPLVPELLVRDFTRSLAFYCDLLGFQRLYGRVDPAFAYLAIDDAQLMIEQMEGDSWLTGDMTPPLGRGINLQIEVSDVDGPVTRLTTAGWPLFRQVEEAWYRVDDQLYGQRQFLVQDPDGYLLRFCRELGCRAAEDAPADGRVVS